jgi:hypothetical protein
MAGEGVWQEFKNIFLPFASQFDRFFAFAACALQGWDENLPILPKAP